MMVMLAEILALRQQINVAHRQIASSQFCRRHNPSTQSSDLEFHYVVEVAVVSMANGYRRAWIHGKPCARSRELGDSHLILQKVLRLSSV